MRADKAIAPVLGDFEGGELDILGIEIGRAAAASTRRTASRC